MIAKTPGLLALGFLLGCSAVAPRQTTPHATSPVRIAACQILVDGDREAALSRIDLALAEAQAQGAHIALFPEACLLGWTNPAAHTLADPIPGPTTDRLAALAQKYELMLVVGMAERDGQDLHNAAVLIDRDGTLLLKHRKLNILSELMEPPYVPGKTAAHSTADTRYGRVGLLICADTFQDETVGQLAAASPDLVLVPYGWAAPEQSWPDHGRSLHSWIAHTARRTGAPVLGVDSVGEIVAGPWKGQVLGGQSAFSDFRGKLSTPMADRAAEVRVFEVQD